MPGRALSQPGRFAGPAIGVHLLFFLHPGQVRPQPIARGLSVTIREFHQVRFAAEIALAGNAIDEVFRRLHAVASPGEFVAQMLRTLSCGILRAVANEANAGCPGRRKSTHRFPPSSADPAPTRSRR